MDEQRFDSLTVALSEMRGRRAFFRLVAATGLAASGLGAFVASDASARRRPTITPTTTTTLPPKAPPPDRCGGPVGICNADPTPCGKTASGEICGCERSVEGNNFCANSGADNVCDLAKECTSTAGEEETSCRNLVGFHFVCQEAKRGATGKFCGCGFGTTTGRVCVPECDNPTVKSGAGGHGGKARGKQRRRRKASR